MKKLVLVVGFLLPLLIVGLTAAYLGQGQEEYARFKGPDGRYQVVVYRHPVYAVLPGQGSDAPGTLVLMTAGGKVLRQKGIDMVQLVETPRWEGGRVSMKLQFDWKLPE